MVQAMQLSLSLPFSRLINQYSDNSMKQLIINQYKQIISVKQLLK